MLLSGSKISFVFLLFYIGVSNFLIKQEISKIKIKLSMREALLLVVIVGVSLIVTKIESRTGYYLAAQRFFFRVVAEGDIYYMYYPNEIYKKVESINIVSYYTSFFEPLIRRISDKSLNISIGRPIITAVYGIPDPIFGPNTRAEMVWRENLGYFGMVLSMIIAYLISFIRRIKTNNFFNIYILTILIVNVDLMLRDMELFYVLLRGGILVLPTIILLTLIFRYFEKHQERG